jgi:tetratricopeptide (TPR) repeat protein
MDDMAPAGYGAMYYDQAKRMLTRALENVVQSENIDSDEAGARALREAEILAELGEVFALEHDEAFAARLLQRSLEICQNMDLRTELPHIYHLIGMVHLEIGDVQAAVEELSRALRLYASLPR